MIKHYITGFCFSALVATPLSAAVIVHQNEESGLLTWVSEEDGFSLELIQLLPDFVRAIYEAHEFPKEEIEKIAEYCVFGTIIKNTSSETVHYSVSDWRYIDNNGHAQVIKTKTEWLKQWRKAGIVFSWTLLPDEQSFSAGDWQQGFTTILHPRETSFGLSYSWTVGGVKQQALLENLQCAPKELLNEQE